MRATFLADLFRSGGLEVIEYDGWKTRGSDRFTPLGDVIHHTATGPKVSDLRVAQILRDGRPDLAGPLVQRGTDRAGRIHLVASGRASHNGYGLWGNDAYGNELFNDGVGEWFPEIQIRSAEIQSALLRKHHGWTADKVKAHKETDPRRKIDPYRMDMNAFRQAVEDLMHRPIEGDPFPMLTDEEQKTLLGNTQTLVDELFHWPEVTEPVAETGQRKSQIRQTLANAEKVPEILRRQVLVEAAVADQAKLLAEIRDAVKASTPPEPTV